MAPRTRKVTPPEKGLVHFLAGVSDPQVDSFIKINGIEGTPKTKTAKHFTVKVTPGKEYTIPDDMYVWLDFVE